MLSSQVAGLRTADPPALSPASLSLAVVSAVVLAGGIGVRIGLDPSGAVRTAAVVVALAGAVGLALVAVRSFRLFLLVLFAVRPLLDAFQGGGAGAGVLDPSLAVGGAFLVVGSCWLMAQASAGLLVAPSRTSWAVIGLLLATALSVPASAQPLASASAAARVAAGALMFIVLEQMVHQHPLEVRRLYASAAASLVVPALVALGQAATAGSVSDSARIRSTFVHPNALASYVVLLGLSAIALAPHLDGRARLVARLVAGVCLPLLLLTYGRAAWLGFMVGVLVIGALQSRRLIVGTLLGVLLVVAFVPSVSQRFADLSQERQVGRGDPNSFAFRLRYWSEVAPLANSTPVVGIGIDMVERSTPERLLPHNTFLQAYVETGVVGLLALLGVLWAMCRDLALALRTSPERGWVVAGIASAVGFGVQLGTENLLTQVLLLWYLAVPVTLAIGAGRRAHSDMR